MTIMISNKALELCGLALIWVAGTICLNVWEMRASSKKAKRVPGSAGDSTGEE